MIVRIENLYGKYNYCLDFKNKINFLIGENGIGKTTILKILALILDCNFIELVKYEFDRIVIENSDKKLRIEYNDLVPPYYAFHDHFPLYYRNLLKEMKKDVNNAKDFIRKNEEFMKAIQKIQEKFIPQEDYDRFILKYPKNQLQSIIAKDMRDYLNGKEYGLHFPIKKYATLADEAYEDWIFDIEHYDALSLIKSYNPVRCLNFSSYYNITSFLGFGNFNAGFLLKKIGLKKGNDFYHNFVDFNDTKRYKLEHIISSKKLKILLMDLQNILLSKNDDSVINAADLEIYCQNPKIMRILKNVLFPNFKEHLCKLTEDNIPHYQSIEEDLRSSLELQERVISFTSKNEKDKTTKEIKVVYRSAFANNPLKDDVLELGFNEFILTFLYNLSSALGASITNSIINGSIDENGYLELTEDELKLNILGMYQYILENYENIMELRVKEVTHLETVLNKYLYNKNTYVYTGKDSEIAIYITDVTTDTHLELKQLSSGEQKIIRHFKTIILSKEILLLDEPDLSLSIYWQEQLVPDILEYANADIIIIATQSSNLVTEEYIGFLIPIERVE